MPARDYEILYIVKPDLDEEAVTAATKTVDELITGFGGTVQKTDQWGRRKLAYEVQHLREGYYVLTDFRFDPERVPDLEGQLRISETVFRYLVTRKPEKIRSTRARRKAAAAAAQAEREAAAATELEAPAEEEAADATEDTAAEAENDTTAEPAGSEPVGITEDE